MGRVGFRPLLGVIALLLTLPALAPASVRRHHVAPSAGQRIAIAGQLVAHISSRSFAPQRRRPTLRDAARALRQARAHRTCATLAATDALVNDLGTPATWRRSRIPRSLVRAPLAQLAQAGRTLLRTRSGRRCKVIPSSSRNLRPSIGGSGSPIVQPPNQSPEQGGGLDRPIPQGPLHPPKSIGGTSALGPDPRGAADTGRPFGHAASDAFSFFRNSDVGVPPRQGTPEEPTAAIDPGTGVAWYTGNSSVALSTDNGRTWAGFNPSNVLPDQNMPFCCDQLVSYSPSYHMFVWVSQYWCTTGACLVTRTGADGKPHNYCRTDNAYNRIRIAVASPSALRANAANPGRAWTFWDVTPQTVGEPIETWFDRSDMSVNPVNFNWGVDILCGIRGHNTLTGRISLGQLAHRRTVTLSYTTTASVRTTAQGFGTHTTYFVGANSLGQERIWSWAPHSGWLFAHDINHTTVPIFDSGTTGTDGRNWYDRYGIFPGEVESVAYTHHTLYVGQGTGRAYCTAQCDTDTPTLHHVLDQPSIFISKYDVNSWHNVGERWIWNPTLAFGWPALATDLAGDVGLAFRAGAADHNARPVAGFLTPGEQFFYANPEGQPHETGDYYTLRPGRTSRSFVMPAQTVQNDLGAPGAMHWYFIEYGLGTPPYVAQPSVHITTPATGSSYTQGDTVAYRATATDPVDGRVPGFAIRWREDGVDIGGGDAIAHVEASVGTHTVTVTATNGEGRSASDTVTIHVNPPSPALSVVITAPKDGSSFQGQYDQNVNGYCANVAFATQTNGGSGATSYSWSDVRDGGPSQVVASGANPTIELCAPPQVNSSSTHDVTVTATDGGHTATATVRVYISAPTLK